MGEAIDLVNHFKIENVIFNCGEFNDLEKELIKVLDSKNVKYYSCIKELNISNYKFLFMGDVGVEKENDILEKYSLKNIDFLKIGHHGSRKVLVKSL